MLFLFIGFSSLVQQNKRNHRKEKYGGNHTVFFRAKIPDETAMNI
jgi:hypothetical protein